MTKKRYVLKRKEVGKWRDERGKESVEGMEGRKGKTGIAWKRKRIEKENRKDVEMGVGQH